MARNVRLPADTDLDHLAAIQQLAITLMRQHNLSGWSVQWDGAQIRAGQCRRRQKIISLSAQIMARWPVNECRDTILHEIAHALTPGHGHDYAFYAKCREIGARPERCYDASLNSVPWKWTGTCPNGHAIHRHRLTAAAERSSCPRCSPRYDARFKFTWKEN